MNAGEISMSNAKVSTPGYLDTYYCQFSRTQLVVLGLCDQ
jgi:hypothetical protein